MAETLLGLVFLSTTFMIAHLLSDIDRYMSIAHDLRAKYIFSDPSVEPVISKHVLIKNYQDFRTLKTHIGIILTVFFGCFSIGILSLWTWALSFINDSAEYGLWGSIVLALMVLAFLFQIAEYMIIRRVYTIIYELLHSPVCGMDISYREYCLLRITENEDVDAIYFSSKHSLTFTSKLLITLSKLGDYISFAIITGQLGVMYWILAIMMPEFYNPVIMMFIVIGILFSWIIHIWRFNAYSTPELPVELSGFD
ncbi:MAG: hypothetical protein KAR35_05220 [Candidatus Heimdallarchaeota archaeon]|nr:hypothetical protein [Candidatus Heimdallarchaeota archaeon]MCK5048758.1 hypothetical protein [Candidatus Heimdallarchaeota archaeon]